MTNSIRPQAITIDRPRSLMNIIWEDGHRSDYSLRWLRANCPCATCREERRAAALDTDPLRLVATPAPNTEIGDAELVGQYAIRFTWRDGHGTGIYPFAELRRCCPCADCNPDGPPPLILD